MQRVMRLSWLLLLVLSASHLAGSQAAPQPPANPEFWGMVARDPLYEWNTNPAYPNTVNKAFVDQMFSTMEQAGVRWIRFEFHAVWDGSPYGGFNFAQADYFIEAAHAHNIKVLALLGTDILKGPEAAVARLDGGTVSGEIPPGGPDSPYCAEEPIGCYVNPYLHNYLERARWIARRYSGSIDAYELFNEENVYWALWEETLPSGKGQDEINPLHVARAISKFARILRSEGDPTPVILGGLLPSASRESGRTDRQYIAAIYASSPFAAYKSAYGRWPVDGIGYHTYPVSIAPSIQSDNDYLDRVGPRLDEVIATVRGFDATAQLWITEAGTRGNPNVPADLQRQSEFLRLLVEIVRQRGADVAVFFWFKYEDFPPASEAWGVVTIPFDAQGAYDRNGAVALYKPAFWQYMKLARNLQPRAGLPVLIR